MGEIKIWLTYHDDKQIEEYNLRENDTIKLFKGNNMDVEGENINNLNKYYSELVTLYYVWKNKVYSQYVGFEHYRRKFHQIFRVEQGQCQVWDIVKGCNIFYNYKEAHNYRDLYDLIEILNKKYGLGNKYTDYLLNGTVFIPFCCFIMQYGDYEKMAEWLFSILFAWDEKNKLFMNPEKYMEKAQKDFRYENVNYQCRAIGFLAERLISSYIILNMDSFCVRTVNNNS